MLVETHPRNIGSQSLFVTLLPWLMAVCFALLAMRGTGTNNVVDTDAARHAINGAFLHDMVAEGQITKPMAYGKAYYSHLPALSMPYHPPLFPALEGLVFGIWGVSGFSAHLTVALGVAINVLLFYHLIVSTGGSRLAAVATVVTFFTWRISVNVSNDVMLEMPSLVFILLALLVIRDLDKGLSLKQALSFAIFATAAVWTKQHALFLLIVPIVGAFLWFSWKTLANLRLIMALILTGIGCLLLASLSIPMHNAGVNQLVYELDQSWFSAVPLHHLRYYGHVFPYIVGAIPFCLILAAPVAWIWLVRKKWPGLWLFGSWALSAFLLLVVLGPYDDRYLFYVYPPLLAIAYEGFERICRQWLRPGIRWVPVAACGTACAAIGLASPVPFLSGPAEAAAMAVNGKQQRVVYCGSADGNFIFAVRARDPHRQTTVVRGEPLLEQAGSPERFTTMLQAYGVSRLIVEHTQRKQPCNAVSGALLNGATLTNQLPMHSSLVRFNGGTLSIYDIPQGGKTGQEPLQIIVPKLGVPLEVKD